MITFLRGSLCFFAGCAGLGLLPSVVLAARRRNPGGRAPGMALAILAVTAYVVFVLVASAVRI